MPSQDNQYSDLIFLDVETTGLLHHSESRIVEIGLSHWNSSGHCARYTSLINPQETIPELYTRIHGINDEMVKNAPTFREYWEENEELFQGKTIIAHNLSFDVGMLNRELSRLGKSRIGNSGIDTVPVLRKLLPNQKNHKLQTLAENLGVAHARKHRAEDDVNALEQILAISLENPLTVLTGGLGINFSMWGGISSHRYFKDIIHCAQSNETDIRVVLATRESPDSPNRTGLEIIRVARPAYSSNRLGEFREKGRYPISWSDVYRIESL